MNFVRTFFETVFALLYMELIPTHLHQKQLP